MANSIKALLFLCRRCTPFQKYSASQLQPQHLLVHSLPTHHLILLLPSRGVIVKPDFGGARYLVPLYELTIKSFSSHKLSTLSTSSLPMLSCQRVNHAVPVASDIVVLFLQSSFDIYFLKNFGTCL